MAKRKPGAAELHASSWVIDLHSDVHLDVVRQRGRGETRVLKRRHWPKWKKGGVNAVILNTIPKFGPDPYPYQTDPTRNFLLTMDAVFQDIAETPECFALVLEPEDLLAAREAGKVGLLIGLEGAEAVGRDLGLVRCFYRLGLRVMNLTWHQRNLVADGVAEPSNAGLSHFGRELVAELNRLGIFIDVSHLSPKGIDDVLALSSAPVLASHSNAKAVHPHERNLDDRRIRRIARKGGLIGVTFLGRFVADRDPDIEQVLDHIEHIVKVAGADSVGIGPDYCDYVHDLIIASRRVAGPGMPVQEKTIPYARGLEDASKLPRLTEGLLRRGFDQQVIKRILGENFLDLFTRVRKGV